MNKDIVRGNLFFLGCGLVLSSIMYFIHYLFFSNIYETLSSIILSIAYVPIGIIYQTYIINIILEKRDLLTSKKKINIIIGSFYYEVGIDIISILTKGDNNIEAIREYTIIKSDWVEPDFERLKVLLENHYCDLDISKIQIENIYEILDSKDEFILNLMTNVSINDCDDFNELLITMLHLRDEFQGKYYNGELKNCEANYIKKDLCKAYRYLIIQWIDYIKSLKEYYPFLYEKALKSSPFDNRSEEEKAKEYYCMSRDI